MTTLQFLEPILQRLAWTLVHFVWQGLAIALLLVMTVGLGRVHRSALRYAFSLFALVGMLLAPLATFVWMPSRPVPGPSVSAEFDALRSFGPADGSITFAARSDADPAAAAGGRPTAAVVAGTASLEPAVLTSGLSAVVLRGSVSSRAAWQFVRQWIVLGWFLGVTLLSARLLAGWIGVWRLRRRVNPVPEELDLRMRQLAARMNVAIPLLRLSQRLTEAIAIGFIRPMILLPAAWVAAMPPDMLDAVIAHELAHIRRRDLWVNLLQRFVETLLFYHPAIWWLSRRLRRERELCCDERVIEVTRDPLRYAQTLEHIGRLSVAGGNPGLVMSIRGSGSILVDRIRNILGLDPREHSGWSWVCGALPLLLAGLACWAAGSHVQVSAWADGQDTAAAQEPTAVGDAEQVRVQRGKVVDSQGNPVANAEVKLFQKLDQTTNDPPVLVLATRTDARGIFELKGPADTFESAAAWSAVPWPGPGERCRQGWGVRPAHLREAPLKGDGTPDTAVPADSEERFIIRLSHQPCPVEVTDSRQKPVAGAKVTILAVSRVKPALDVELERSEANLRLPVSRPISVAEALYVPADLRAALRGATNADGIAVVEGFHDCVIRNLEVETESFGRQVVSRQDSYRQSAGRFRLQLAPVGRIDGRLAPDPRAAAAGFNPENLQLNFRTVTAQPLRKPAGDASTQHPWLDGIASAVVAADGTFSVPAIAEGAIELQSVSPADSPFIMVPPGNALVRGVQSLNLTLAVHKQVSVRGVVRRRGSNEPVPGVAVMLTQFTGPGYFNPKSTVLRTDATGHYETGLRPGEVEIRLQNAIDGLATVHAWEHQHPRASIGLHDQVPNRDGLVELPALELVPTERRTGQLLDQQGRPVSTGWDVVGFPSPDTPWPSARGGARDHGQFKLIFPQAYPPTLYAAVASLRSLTEPATQLEELKVISEEPLVLQFQGIQRRPRTVTPDGFPITEGPELAALRRHRQQANDRAAAKDLCGEWTLTLPRGFVYSIRITQHDDGGLLVESQDKLLLRGVYTLKGKRLELIEPVGSNVDDLIWDRQPDGSFRLVHEQHRAGGHYIGAVLARGAAREVESTPAAKSGLFHGVVKITGDLPEVPPIRIQPDLKLVIPRNDDDRQRNKQAVASTPVVEIPDDSLVVFKNGGLANVLIYLPAPPAGWKPTAAPQSPVLLRVEDWRFVPHVSRIRVGQPLTLAAAGDVASNFVAMGNASPFNRLVARSTEVTLDKPFAKPERLPVSIKSFINSWMNCWVLVLDHPFSAVTDHEGRFAIPDLPAGRHEFIVWHERTGYLDKRLVVDVPDSSRGVTLTYDAQRFRPRPARPAVIEPVRSGFLQQREIRRQKNERDAARKLVGCWKLTMPAGFVFDVEITQAEDGCLTLASKKASNLMGRYILNGQSLELVEHLKNDVDFIWQLQDQNLLKLLAEHHQSGPSYLGATLKRVALGAEAP